MQSTFYYLKRIRSIVIVQVLQKICSLTGPIHEHGITIGKISDRRQNFNQNINDSNNTVLKCTDPHKYLPEIAFQKMSQSSPKPTRFQKTFFRLADALVAATQNSDENNTLCIFAYEQKDGSRKFVVVHPETYWWKYIRKPPECRHSYEVIPEGSPCWLYLDLEFKTKLNPESDGSHMTNTLIDIFCAYMLLHCGIHCNKTNVVNLDSTTNEKFSRHLIFSIKDVAFENNLHVGGFVKFVCAEIEHFLNYKNMRHDILSYFKRAHLEELFIDTERGKTLFVDTGVYTRNRTFRVYKSSKFGKRSYLTVCSDSKHIPLRNYENKELGIFLDSLISYFPNKQNLITIKFDKPVGKFKLTCHEEIKSTDYTGASPYPELDQFVAQMIYPGRIRTVVEFNPAVFIYAVTGNRYCENIGRWHKSNHIFWVVDLNKKMMYQKCHDRECRGFRSKPIRIPNEINSYHYCY